MATEWDTQNKSAGSGESFFLKIDDTFFLLIDEGYKLLLQDGGETPWVTQQKS